VAAAEEEAFASAAAGPLVGRGWGNTALPIWIKSEADCSLPFRARLCGSLGSQSVLRSALCTLTSNCGFAVASEDHPHHAEGRCLGGPQIARSWEGRWQRTPTPCFKPRGLLLLLFVVCCLLCVVGVVVVVVVVVLLLLLWWLLLLMGS